MIKEKISLPYKFKPLKHQELFLDAWDSGIKRMIIVWHRRAGKDKVCFANLPKKMFEKKAAYFYLAPTYKQGKKIIWDNIDNDGFKMLGHIPKELIKNKNENEMKIELTNGSYVQVVGTENVDNILGSNPYGCVFTEYSIHQENVWNLIRPILAFNGGWAIFNFTPRGTNHAYKLLEQAKGNSIWFTQILTVDDTKLLSKEDLEEERRQMPNDLFQQEYYCKFVDGASQFFKGIEKCIYKEPYEEPENGHTYQMGVDLAKMNDYTVITPFDLNDFRVGKQEVFNQIDYNLQKSKIISFYSKFNRPLTRIDSTGIGDPISDDLYKDVPNLERYLFTSKSRMDLLTNLQILIEQQKIKIPDDPTLIGQLKSFEYILGDKGKVSAGCDDSLHDDQVMSLALAVYNIPDKPLPVINQYQEFKQELFNEALIDPKTGYWK